MTSTPGPTMQVVPGWELAVLGADGVPPIKEGGIRTVRIPPELAYGEGELQLGVGRPSGMPLQGRMQECTEKTRCCQTLAPSHVLSLVG